MCSKTTCQTCGKATWSGCGNHVEQALAGVPQNQRCTCAATRSSVSSSEGFVARQRAR
jgi:hypothetical protein